MVNQVKAYQEKFIGTIYSIRKFEFKFVIRLITTVCWCFFLKQQKNKQKINKIRSKIKFLVRSIFIFLK